MSHDELNAQLKKMEELGQEFQKLDDLKKDLEAEHAAAKANAKACEDSLAAAMEVVQRLSDARMETAEKTREAQREWDQHERHLNKWLRDTFCRKLMPKKVFPDSPVGKGAHPDRLDPVEPVETNPLPKEMHTTLQNRATDHVIKHAVRLAHTQN